MKITKKKMSVGWNLFRISADVMYIRNSSIGFMIQVSTSAMLLYCNLIRETHNRQIKWKTYGNVLLDPLFANFCIIEF
jgi:hypothetical protein